MDGREACGKVFTIKKIYLPIQLLLWMLPLTQVPLHSKFPLYAFKQIPWSRLTVWKSGQQLQRNYRLVSKQKMTPSHGLEEARFEVARHPHLFQATIIFKFNSFEFSDVW